MERIAGPICGHYLAAYAVSDADGYIGYAKVYAARPISPWEGGIAVWKVAAGPYPIESLAIDAVLAKAERVMWEASTFQVLWDESEGVRR
ncbi:hypothetical protein ASG30_13155 [Ramlibacter sp. Leaf400]|nr:hypothetical protein ASG30_13155 [Ramlibacter sp. Leaf400]